MRDDAVEAEPVMRALTQGEVSATRLLRGGFARWAGVAISLALLVAIILTARDLSLAELWRAIPASPLFWVMFIAYYLCGPVSEWVIYRRLWHIPLSGMTALLRKFVSNELLLGYLGEAQFYAWARSHAGLTATPFGAIKDVTILSAFTGNVATLIILAMVWPLVHANLLGPATSTTFLSLGVVLGTSLLLLLARRRLFTLPLPELRFITLVHSVRIVAVTTLTAAMWCVALPGVAVSVWLLLAALRMLLSRLPLLPNKDVVFAGLAVFLIGQDQAISALLATMAGLLLAVHIALGSVLAAADIVSGSEDI